MKRSEFITLAGVAAAISLFPVHLLRANETQWVGTVRLLDWEVTHLRRFAAQINARSAPLSEVQQKMITPEKILHRGKDRLEFLSALGQRVIIRPGATDFFHR